MSAIDYSLKPALSYEQQLEHLKTAHNLMILDSDSALSILHKVNYYRLSAYSIGLKKDSDPEKFLDDVTLDHIFRLYCFDSEFRNDIVHIVEQLEIQLRTQISYCLALKYGPEGYMDVKNFNDKIKRQGGSVHGVLIKRFQGEVSRCKNLPFVKHHLNKYGGHFPIWAATELMTFGNIVSLFDIMKPDDQKEISSLYETTPGHLKSWMLSLVEIRNICAHYNRLYNMPLKQTPFLYKENRKYRSKQNKVFPVFLVIKRMLHGNEQWESFLRDIDVTLRKYSDVVNLSFIGFLQDWQEVLSAPAYSKQRSLDN